MAVKQRQRLACMHGHCHATERQRTGLKLQGANIFVPDFGKHVSGPRLSATPSDHAFQPRLPATSSDHAFSATPSGYVYQSRTICFSSQPFVRASEPLADTVVLELVDDVIDGQEGHVDDVHPHIEIRRHGINTSMPKTTEANPQSQLSFITEATGAPIFENGKTLGHTQCHCADAFHLTLRVEGLDAVKHHARRFSMAKWFVPAMMSIRLTRLHVASTMS